MNLAIWDIESSSASTDFGSIIEIGGILFSLILGGAAGNFFDRVVYFAVPDFIDIHYQRFHWFTFNIADIFITTGIFLLIIKEIFFKNEKN